jgi:hypothetical protein
MGMSPVGVPASDQRPSSDTAPDPDGLGGPVVEDAHLRLVDDGGFRVGLLVAQAGRAADDTLRRDAVDVARNYPGQAPWSFIGGTILRAAVDVSGEPSADLAAEPRMAFMRD